MMVFVRLLRVRQWLKNLILFFPPLLGGAFFETDRWLGGGGAFFAFCLASSASYIVNDVHDREQDRLHPRKRHRPIASGAVGTGPAVLLATLLLGGAGALAWRQPPMFGVWLLAYLLLSFAYSFGLKHQPILDIFCIASGFVFRLFAGGAVFGIRISDWLFLSVLLLAVFLSAGKRSSEKRLLGEDSGAHRKALEAYPDGVLEGFMLMTGAAVLVTYTMYAISHRQLVYSVPLCCFGLFRYILIVERGSGGDPTDSLLKDPVLFLVGAAWVVMVTFSIYFT